MIGQTISHYKILEKLGEGGMGVVYKAQDLKLQRAVALKFLARGEDRRATQQLIDEARAAASLDHPNICTVYEIGEADGRVFIAMAFLEGVGLDDSIRAGTLGAADAVRIAIQIARSLAAAHARGVVHRDVKPGNVIVASSGRARLMDFGLAARTEASGGVAEDPGRGTPAYMSPEQLLRRPYDGRTDVWSWGVVVYEMLTGRLPFSDASPRTLVEGILRDDPASPCDLCPELSPELGRIVLRALARDPAERYATAADALHDLEIYERRHAHRAAPDTAPPRSVAVLAFRDLSEASDQGHLGEGIADQIIRDLDHIAGLEVAPRTSTFALRDREIDIREIGERLRVSSVVAGSVRRSDERLRITAELRNAADGDTLWSEAYDRDIGEVFEVEEAIARQVAHALDVKVDGSARRFPGRPASRDIEAYDYYLRGRQFFYRSNRRGIECAIEMFTSATARDAGYASAWAGLADCHAYLFMYYGGDPAELAAAEAASARALELGPELAEAHAARGFTLSLSGRYDEAEAAFTEAIRLNPRLFEAWYFRARMAYARGRFELAARMFEEASRVNPDDYQSASLEGFCLRGLGLPRRAEIAYLRAFEKVERHLRLNPDDARALYLGGDCLVKTGRPERGTVWVEKALRLEPDDPYIVYGGACVFALTGRRDEALHWLARAVDAGFAHREWLEHDTDFNSIRDDPSFRAIVERLPEVGCQSPQ